MREPLSHPAESFAWRTLMALEALSIRGLVLVGVLLSAAALGSMASTCGGCGELGELAAELEPQPAGELEGVEPLAGAPVGHSKAIAVSDAANTAIEFSSTFKHELGDCLVTGASGVGVYVVNSDDTDTSNGRGPFCDTCAGGPRFPVGVGYARTAAGSTSMRCTFYDRAAPGLAGGGGVGLGLADARYLKLDGSNDPMTGALTVPQLGGTLPSINFDTDVDTGLSATNGVTGFAFTVDGAARGFITSTALTGSGTTGTPRLHLAGTDATTPPYAFDGDPNTGLRRSAADTVSVVTGGVDRLTVSSTGVSSTSSTSSGWTWGGDNTAAQGFAALNLSYGGAGGIELVRHGPSSGVSKFGVSMQNWSLLLPWGTTAGLAVGTQVDSPVVIGQNNVERTRWTSTATTHTLPQRTANGSAAAPSHAFTSFSDAGLWYDNAAGGVILSDNSGHVGIDANGAGSDVLITGADDVTVQAEGDDLALAAADAVVVTAPGGLQVSTSSILGTVTTGTGDVTRFIRLHGASNATPGSKPTCSATSDDAYGSIIFFDDTNDATPGRVLVCAADAGGTVAWRAVADDSAASFGLAEHQAAGSSFSSRAYELAAATQALGFAALCLGCLVSGAVFVALTLVEALERRRR